MERITSRVEPGQAFGDTMELIVMSLPQQISLVSDLLHTVEPFLMLPFDTRGSYLGHVLVVQA